MRIDKNGYLHDASPVEMMRAVSSNPGSRLYKMETGVALRNELSEIEQLIAKAIAAGLTIKRDADGNPVAYIKPSKMRK